MKSKLIEKWGDYAHRRFGVRELSQSIPELEAWLQTPLGQLLIQQQQQRLEQLIGDLFGYEFMQLSIDRNLDLTGASRINHRFGLGPLRSENDKAEGGSFIHAQSQMDSLPLPSNSIDVAVMHHVLEFSPNPHQLLREVSRVVIPRGHLIIVGFNPLSLWGLWKHIAQFVSRKPQWRHHSLRLGRLVDWLHLLDFEPTQKVRGFFRPPVKHSGIMQKFERFEKLAGALQPPGGSFYIVVARKEILGMTPIKPVWGGATPVPGMPLARTAAKVPAQQPEKTKQIKKNP